MTTSELEQEIGEALVDARCGDRIAFARLVALTQGMVTALALSITSDPAASEDIAQETYLEVWRRLPALYSDASVLPWLREVARNRAIDVLRRRRSPPPNTGTSASMNALPSTHPGPDDSLEAEQRAATALRALQSLPSQSREVVLLYYREGERSGRVAALLGVSEATVRKRLQRARDRLRLDLARPIRAFALHSTPGAAFGAVIAASLGPVGAPAAGAATASAVKAGFLKFFGAGLAAISLPMLAVAVDTRLHLARARNRLQRRRLIVHGMVYALLMGSYMLALNWMARHDVGTHWTLGLAIGASLLIFALTYWRLRILRNPPRSAS